MKTNQDKYLEEITDKLMKETSLEKPSPNFTVNVMFQVLAADSNTSIVYKPLISKMGWVIIFGSFILLLAYLSINGSVKSGAWLNLINFSEINNSIIKNFTGFRFSAITIYASVISAIMLFIQITYLKHYFNKRFES